MARRLRRPPRAQPAEPAELPPPPPSQDPGQDQPPPAAVEDFLRLTLSDVGRTAVWLRASEVVFLYAASAAPGQPSAPGALPGQPAVSRPSQAKAKPLFQGTVVGTRQGPLWVRETAEEVLEGIRGCSAF